MSGSTLGDALNDPGVLALLGAAQGFGQAAMPSRLPVPFGAVLGEGAGGLLQGIRAGQQGQLAQQQIKQAQLQNQMTGMYVNALPGAVPGMAPLGAPAPASPGAGGAFTTPSAASGSSGASPTSPPSSGPSTPSASVSANGQYLVPPSQSISLGNLALLRGDPAAAATFYGQAQSAAGGPGYAMGQNGGAFAVPGGAQDPRVVAARSAAEKGGGLPATLAEQGFMMGPGGTLVPIPGGKADPNYLSQSAAATSSGTKSGEAPFVAPQSFKVPTVDGNGQPVLDAAGRPTFHDQLMTVPQANAAATAGAGNPSYADPFPAWATKINGSENPTGNPAAPNASGPGGAPTSSAMGNGQFLAGTWPSVIRAARPDIAAGKTDAQLMPLRGDADLAQSATEQYARMNGAALAQAGLPVTGATVALAHGLGPTGAMTVLRAQPNAPLAMLPGMAPTIAANPSLRNMTAGGLIQQYQTQMGGPQAMPGIAGPPALTPQQMPYDLRQSGMHVDPVTAQVIKNPEAVKMVMPGGQTVEGHMNPASPYDPPGTPGTFAPVVTAPSPGGSAAPAGAAPGSPLVTALPADVVKGREQLTEGLFGKDTDSYIAANNTQGWLNQINHAASVMQNAGAAYQTGPFAKTRLELMGDVNDGARTLGLAAPFDQTALSSSEEMRKATTTAGFELASHYEGHAKQAAATIMNATSAVPGMGNSPQGLTLVSDGINEGAQSAIDMHNYKIARFSGQDPYGIAPDQVGKQGGAGLESAEADFVKAFPASMYSNRAISTVTPFKITATDLPTAMKQMSQYLPGTYVTLPNGKQTMVPERPGAPPIPTYLRTYAAAGSANVAGGANATP